MTDHADAFITAIDLRVRDILDRCTRCAKCVEVCPTATPAGIDTSEPSAIVGDVLDILRGGVIHQAEAPAGPTRAPAPVVVSRPAMTALIRVSCWRRPA